jgi:hypothetical protein
MTSLDRLARIVLHGTPAELEAWARDHQAKRKRQAVKKAPRWQEVTDAKLARRDNWQRTRAAVLARANGRCEMCGHPNLCLDPHHLASGPLRRKYEAPNSVVACCRTCHRGWHRGDLVDLSASQRVAERIGAPDIVLANLSRRIERATQCLTPSH